MIILIFTDSETQTQRLSNFVQVQTAIDGRSGFKHSLESMILTAFYAPTTTMRILRADLT